MLELVLKAYYIDDKILRELYNPSTSKSWATSAQMNRVDSGISP